MTTITQITHGHPAYAVVTEFLEHEVGRVHGRFIPVADEQAYVVEPTTGHPYLKVEVFVQGLPIVEDEIPTRTTCIPLTKEHRVLQAIHPR